MMSIVGQPVPGVAGLRKVLHMLPLRLQQQTQACRCSYPMENDASLSSPVVVVETWSLNPCCCCYKLQCVYARPHLSCSVPAIAWSNFGSILEPQMVEACKSSDHARCFRPRCFSSQKNVRPRLRLIYAKRPACQLLLECAQQLAPILSHSHNRAASGDVESKHPNQGCSP